MALLPNKFLLKILIRNFNNSKNKLINDRLIALNNNRFTRISK
jgi:hypothetical protein